MARGDDVKAFAQQHQLPILTIEELVVYRRQQEQMGA
jgi:3,4-dihydroxy-2-butanone 4-phosphate synthase